MDVLRESLEAKERSTESIISYNLAMREKLAKMSELVEQNMSRSQNQQKAWYDRTARTRRFEPGDKVFVLLPTSTNKLLAQWEGPYDILRKVGRVTYEVDMVDKRKRY